MENLKKEISFYKVSQKDDRIANIYWQGEEAIFFTATFIYKFNTKIKNFGNPRLLDLFADKERQLNNGDRQVLDVLKTYLNAESIKINLPLAEVINFVPIAFKDTTEAFFEISGDTIKINNALGVGFEYETENCFEGKFKVCDRFKKFFKGISKLKNQAKNLEFYISRVGRYNLFYAKNNNHQFALSITQL